jgi:PAS domain S-box-containing protein
MSCLHLSRVILDSLSEGVFTVDADYRITSFNRSAEEITGIAPDEAQGQLCSDVLHSTLCESRCPIRRALAQCKPVTDQRCYFVDIEGERVPISVSAAALVDDQGGVIGGVETFRDLSELEAMRHALQHKASRLSSRNPAMQQVLDLVSVLATSPTSVLICGETGTGKEVIARAIHEQGPRAAKPFVAINCAALPESLLESELFGYKKGAFTGADHDKPGRFSLVRDGTLFLDEIGEISLAMQVRLLRVLEAREFEPLGSTKAEALKARIIAASHRDLQKRVAEGAFREDLYYRLVVIRMDLPPLRERREDIPALAMELLARINAQQESHLGGISPAAMEILQNNDWPGNVRQLSNIIERAAVLCRGDLIGCEHLPLEWQASKPPALSPLPAHAAPVAQVRQQAEADAILAALRENGFRRQQTALQLGMHPTTLYRKIKAWKLLSQAGKSQRARFER